MGWKRIRDHFRIGHIVHVRDGKVLIGSSYCTDLLTVHPDGRVEEGSLGHGGNADLTRYWKELRADPALVASLFAAPDEFTRSLTVYGYDGGKIIEKQCEQPGWPNVTHDGELMYDNSYSESRAEVVGWAQDNAAARVRWMRGRVTELETSLATARENLADAERSLAEAQSLTPDTEGRKP
jgi:hypothetical protein